MVIIKATLEEDPIYVDSRHENSIPPTKKKKSEPQKSYIPEVKMDFFSEKSDLPTFWMRNFFYIWITIYSNRIFG